MSWIALSTSTYTWHLCEQAGMCRPEAHTGCVWLIPVGSSHQTSLKKLAAQVFLQQLHIPITWAVPKLLLPHSSDQRGDAWDRHLCSWIPSSLRGVSVLGSLAQASLMAAAPVHCRIAHHVKAWHERGTDALLCISGFLPLGPTWALPPIPIALHWDADVCNLHRQQDNLPVGRKGPFSASFWLSNWENKAI